MSKLGWDRSGTIYEMEDKHYFLTTYFDGERNATFHRWKVLEKKNGNWIVGEGAFPEHNSKEEAVSYFNKDILKLS